MHGSNAPAGTTPMMAQYLTLKAEAGDCLLFYRMGDFFELFFDDARTAAQVLDIALTSRGEHQGAPVPMCGVPVHSAEGYLARLIKAGCRVAIAEQVETPEEAKKRGGSKALVARDIVRFVTAGTLTEEALLEPRRANVLAAVCEVRGTIGLAACDISTGRMELEECSADRLGAEQGRPAQLRRRARGQELRTRSAIFLPGGGPPRQQLLGQQRPHGNQGGDRIAQIGAQGDGHPTGRSAAGGGGGGGSRSGAHPPRWLRSSSCTGCSTGIGRLCSSMWRRICRLQPMLAVTATAAPVPLRSAALIRPSSAAVSGSTRL